MLPICCPSPSRCGARRAEGSRAGPCPPVPIARSLRHHPSRRTSRSGDHDMGVQMSSFCGRLTHRRDRRGFTPTRGKIRVPNVAVRPSATARPTTRRLRGTAFGAPPSGHRLRGTAFERDRDAELHPKAFRRASFSEAPQRLPLQRDARLPTPRLAKNQVSPRNRPPPVAPASTCNDDFSLLP